MANRQVLRGVGHLGAKFDRRGRMVAQANTGTPGHINSLAIAGAHLVRIFANNLKPGDVVTMLADRITDAVLGAGR